MYYLDGDDWVLFYSWVYTDPEGDLHYGGGPSYQFDPDVHDMSRSYLELMANLDAAIAARYFKAEFVQYGASGSRIIELDAYGELQAVPEPSTLFLLGSGLVGFSALTRKIKKP